MLRWAVALVFVPGCCTEIGCSGAIVIFLDRPLAEGAVVTVDAGDGPLDCGASLEDRAGSCRIDEEEGRPAIVVDIGTDEVPPILAVDIAEDGDPVGYEVVPVEGEPWHPNGRRCGPSCNAGEAELVLART